MPREPKQYSNPSTKPYNKNKLESMTSCGKFVVRGIVSNVVHTGGIVAVEKFVVGTISKGRHYW